MRTRMRNPDLASIFRSNPSAFQAEAFLLVSPLLRASNCCTVTVGRNDIDQYVAIHCGRSVLPEVGHSTYEQFRHALQVTFNRHQNLPAFHPVVIRTITVAKPGWHTAWLNDRIYVLNYIPQSTCMLTLRKPTAVGSERGS
jgi:hypothetical protein